MARAAVQKVGRQDPVGRAFGDRVRALREQADLTLDQLSKLSGVSRAMLSQVERGEKESDNRRREAHFPCFGCLVFSLGGR
ncbi:helix-turn-helix domain-containing protein [Mesorhizobium sp. ORM8.1]